MSGLSRQSPMVDASHFAMIPRSDVPRSVFRSEHGHKTTFDAMDLIPVYVQEVLPGDQFHVRMTAFVRMQTMIFPLMDSVELCSFFFFVPNRLVWDNWVKFMGEQKDPGDSISFLIPQVSHANGPASLSLFDYFGLPILRPNAWSHSALPMRSYNLIYNEWFRDENLSVSRTVLRDNGPDSAGYYQIVQRSKRHDYFTSALPFAQKGAAASVPLSGTAPILGIGIDANGAVIGGAAVYQSPTGIGTVYANAFRPPITPVGSSVTIEAVSGAFGFGPNIRADLSAASAVTINQLRLAFQIQKLLERDARGGTRYTEIVRSHFGVLSPDSRLQRPEYLGGGCTPVQINPIAQTSVTAGTPLGNLAGVGHAVASHGYSKAFVEHGHVIGLVSVRANLSYYQGLPRMWSRSTRYDFYWPAFAHLGEQAILNKELFLATTGIDDSVFGYQERWAEYRYQQSKISGYFRSGIGGTLDAWHLAENYTSVPALGPTWIVQKPPMARAYAAGAATNGQQFLFDSLFDTKMTRPMPTYSVPGFVDRF